MNKNDQYRTDPLTGEQFIPKRSNQVFKTRANQIRYNNEKARRSRQRTATTEKSIRKNYRILTDILQKKKLSEVSRDYLDGAGLDFRCFTSIASLNPWSIIIFDIEIKQVSEKHFKIRYTK